MELIARTEKKLLQKQTETIKIYHCPTASPHDFNPEYIAIAPLSLKYNYYSWIQRIH